MAVQPRVVSLLPSATEIAVAVGLGDGLVGRSHECDYPPFVEALPVCTSTKLEKGLTSLQIDDRVQAIVRQGLSVYAVDAPLLRSLRPDVILTQSQCAVCAVTRPIWRRRSPTGSARLRRCSRSPPTRSTTSGAICGGSATRSMRAARPTQRSRGCRSGWRRCAPYSGRRGAADRRCDRMDRPADGGGQLGAEVIDIAGGTPLFAEAGEHSPWLEWEKLVAADPDVIVMMPCGYQIPQTLGDLAPLTGRPGWQDLSAVRNRRVFVADGHHYFNRPGPRLVESAGIIAEVIGPDAGGYGEGWRRLVTADALQA